MKKLNLPSNVCAKNDFDNVSFVNTMSHYSLKVLVKRLWENLQELANTMESNRKDVTMALDQIMSGEKWSVKDIQTRYSFMIHKNEIIQYDSCNNEFNALAVVNGEWVRNAPIGAMTYDQLIKLLKQR